MKKYIKPEIETVELEIKNNLLAAVSGGDEPKTNDQLGNSGGAMQYSKGHTFSVWGDDEEE